MTIEISKVTNGWYSADEIKYRYRDDVVFCRIPYTNTPIAIIGISKMPREVVVIEMQKIPQWKQAMQMQMGRKPKTVTEQRRSYLVSALKQPLDSTRYELYKYVR